MAQRIENMKAVPIKNYDFQVDFKVGESDVLEKFLDPNENKHISVMKRPMTAKTGTWGTAPRIGQVAQKRFETTKPQGVDLTIKGSANADGENAESDNPISPNLFHFKSHLPPKKMSDNPKLALGMFKKKTIGTKSERVLQNPGEVNMRNDPASGFFNNEDLRTKLLAGAQASNAIKHLMSGMGGKKLTAKGASNLKEAKEASALKSSGAGHGFFQKRIMAEVEEGKSEAKKEKAGGGGGLNRPKSAIVSSAVGFMQSLKKGKKLKPPKKPEGYDENEDIENEDGNVQEEEENLGENNEEVEEEKPKKKGAAAGNKLIKPKNVNEFDDTMFNKEEEVAGTESFNPALKNRPQSAQVTRPLPKKQKKKEENEYRDEDYEIDAVPNIQNDTEEEEYNDGTFEDAQEPEEEQAEEQQNAEEEDEQSQEKPASDIKKRFRSNIANMLSELQQDVLAPSMDASFNSNRNSVRTNKQSEKNPSERNSEAKEAKGNNKFEGHKIKKMLMGVKKNGFTPYNYTNDIDGDTAQQQRDQVTDEISDYLRKADEKRLKKLESDQKRKPPTRKKSEVQEINEYSDKIESINSRLQSSVNAMKSIVTGSRSTTTQQNNIIEIDDDDL